METNNPLLLALQRSVESKDEEIEKLKEENGLFHDTLSRLSAESLKINLALSKIKKCQNFEDVQKILEGL